MMVYSQTRLVGDGVQSNKLVDDGGVQSNKLVDDGVQSTNWLIMVYRQQTG